MRRGRPTVSKRQKEMARQQRQLDKRQQRKERNEQKKNSPPRSGAEDPDIAGIRPGPQPLPDEWLNMVDHPAPEEPGDSDH